MTDNNQQPGQTVANDELTCAFAEEAYNGESIDWQLWLVMQNITPTQAAKLVFCIDPIKWPSNDYEQGKIPNHLRIKIEQCSQFLAGQSNEWTVAEIVKTIGIDAVPYAMKLSLRTQEYHLPLEQQAQEKSEAGRYTLEEAADAIQAATLAQSSETLPKLIKAARTGVLKVFPPGSNVPIDYGEGYSKTVRTFYEEAFWNDLNIWLNNVLPLITWEFPAPNTDVAAKLKADRSITKQQVITAFEGLHFKNREGWKNALEDVPKWIEPCRIMPGRRGDNSNPATWNPVLIAVALLEKGIPIKKLDAVFVRLNDWVDEWRESSDYSRD
jgi:hypothetical protein